MKLKIGHSYKIVISINRNLLTYSCKILSIDDNFISFVDKYDKEYSYNLNTIITFEEIKDYKEDNYHD